MANIRIGGYRRTWRFPGAVRILCVLCVLCVQGFSADFALLRNGFEIRHERREATGANTRLYFGTSSDNGYIDVPTEEITGYRPDDTPALIPSTATALNSESRDFRRFVNAASDRHQVDADLITSVIQAESNFNSRARSPKGAQGLMQLMPGTAFSLGVKDAYEPASNIDAGTRYLRELLLRYNDDIAKALAAYNAGPYRVTQYRGVPPYRETHAYVARVIRDFNQKKLTGRKSSPGAHTGTPAHASSRPSDADSRPSPQRSGRAALASSPALSSPRSGQAQRASRPQTSAGRETAATAGPENSTREPAKTPKKSTGTSPD